MSVYYVTIGDHEYHVKVDESVSIDGEPVQCNLVSLNASGLHQLSRDNQSVELCLNSLPRSTYEVLVGGRRVLARVDPAHRRARRSKTQATLGELCAPMPGLITEMLVLEGDVVEEGHALVVQEAMKMQMQLRAPCAGRVEEITVSVGDHVEKGSCLLRVVEEGAAA